VTEVSSIRFEPEKQGSIILNDSSSHLNFQPTSPVPNKIYSGKKEDILDDEEEDPKLPPIVTRKTKSRSKIIDQL